MKDKIFEIMDKHLHCYDYARGDDGEIKVPSEEGSEAAEAIAQLMCDEMCGALMCYIDGKNWENEMIMQLDNCGYTKEQIIKSLNKIKGA